MEKIVETPDAKQYKLFLWRMSHDILPTLQALNRRGITVTDKYFFSAETMRKVLLMHALICCPSLNGVWSNASFNINHCHHNQIFSSWLIDSLMLEALAILEGVKLARIINCQNIIVESDSKQVIEAINNRNGGMGYACGGNYFYL